MFISYMNCINTNLIITISITKAPDLIIVDTTLLWSLAIFSVDKQMIYDPVDMILVINQRWSEKWFYKYNHL